MSADDFDGAAAQDGPLERCTAIVEDVYGGVHAWHLIRAVPPPHTSRCDDDVDEFYIFDQGQVRLCRAHGEAYEQARLQDMGVFDDGKEWKGWSE